MEVKLDKRYPVAASPAQAWTVLRDVRATAACMPGASITEQLDDTHFKGTVKSKVGPAVMQFGGEIELLGVDDAAMQLKMLGKGADKAGSSASMNLVAHLEPGATADSCVLVGQATIVVSGKLAQFGNRLLVPVSDALLAQFANNFNTAASAVAAADTAAAAADATSTMDAAAPADAGTAAATTPSGAAAPEAAPADGLAGAHAPPAAAGTAHLPAAAPQPQVAAPAPALPALRPAPTPAPANELNALSLLWTVFKGWLASLFSKKR